ncbi:MAG: TetR/AcrR family transcriptional regulator [Hyphomicrobiales bacterium]|nr:MAG: TetR/AcrR family transcriptional regulator [Hyphomicrobiales bacterium]
METRGRGRPRASIPKRVGGSTRSEILDAAAELITTQGFGATSTRQIADAVGVRQNVLYHHFASKDDILGALLEALIRPALDAACALSTCPTNDAVDRAARLYALSLYDSQVLATWKWNLGVLFFLPEAHSAVFDSALNMRRALRQFHVDFAAEVADDADSGPVDDHTFRLVESVASIRADGRLTPDSPRHLAVACLRLAGWTTNLDHVTDRASQLLENVYSHITVTDPQTVSQSPT